MLFKNQEPEICQLSIQEEKEEGINMEERENYSDPRKIRQEKCNFVNMNNEFRTSDKLNMMHKIIPFEKIIELINREISEIWSGIKSNQNQKQNQNEIKKMVGRLIVMHSECRKDKRDH